MKKFLIIAARASFAALQSREPAVVAALQIAANLAKAKAATHRTFRR